MNNIYFIADTHYGHKNIVKGVSDWTDKSTCRNFKTIEEMNQAIVKKINQTVKEDDVLYHLGDWSFGGINNIWNFRKQINCKNIYLIYGNHDERIIDNSELPGVYKDSTVRLDENGNLYYYNLTEEFNSNCIPANSRDLFKGTCYYLELAIPNSKKKIVLSHYPIEDWNGYSKGWVHLHGHSHGQALKVNNRLDVYLDDKLKIWSMDEILKLWKN